MNNLQKCIFRFYTVRRESLENKDNSISVRVIYIMHKKEHD